MEAELVNLLMIISPLFSPKLHNVLTWRVDLRRKKKAEHPFCFLSFFFIRIFIMVPVHVTLLNAS